LTLEPRPKASGIAVSIEDGFKSFGDVKALEGVTLEVKRGEFFGLIGPNGAGKSTLMKALIGVHRLDSGKIRVLGMNPNTDPKAIKSVSGVVPESETPPSFLTPDEFMEFVLNIRGKKCTDGIKEEWLRFFDMEGQRGIVAKDLSKGTRQKLMLTSALIHDPPLLLLDEPFINLDPIYQRKVKDRLREYVERGGTVLLSTHILSLAQELCERVAILHKGRLLKLALKRDLIGENGDLETTFLRLVGYIDGNDRTP